jgi:hypothetical protein
VNVVSDTVAVGSVLVAVKAVAPLLTTINLFAFAVSVGSLSKPAVIRSSSDRMDADVACEPVDGNDPCV